MLEGWDKGNKRDSISMPCMSTFEGISPAASSIQIPEQKAQESMWLDDVEHVKMNWGLPEPVPDSRITSPSSSSTGAMISRLSKVRFRRRCCKCSLQWKSELRTRRKINWNIPLPFLFVGRKYVLVGCIYSSHMLNGKRLSKSRRGHSNCDSHFRLLREFTKDRIQRNVVLNSGRLPFILLYISRADISPVIALLWFGHQSRNVPRYGSCDLIFGISCRHCIEVCASWTKRMMGQTGKATRKAKMVEASSDCLKRSRSKTLNLQCLNCIA